ncbi:beta-prism lectin domain-containing protein [Aeromonas salmonicida]|uniref:beta-prism lectin domain-containing protein n=1 Tax=Aeromonas salmonicida TaxID=645 RepID=UPI0022409808|nr:beta-prism lectin domain-containing protein [Aeromonas salmonicida]
MNRYRIYSTLICALLSGCGGGGDGESDNSAQPTPPATTYAVSANDTIHAFKVNDIASVDLKPFTASSDGGAVHLKSLEVLGGDNVCHDAVKDKNGFSLKSDNAASCVFKYTVANEQGGTNSAISRTVVRTVSVEPTVYSVQLTPLSLTLSEYTDGSVDVSNGDLTLADNIIVLGSGTAVTNVANNTILYTAQESGIARILYEMTDSEGAVHLGSVDVAVSQEGNAAPIANNFSYPVTPQVIKPGEDVFVDIKDYISDPDGDNIQLYNVYSFNGLATVASPDDVNNTKIKFKSFVPGTFYITYTITDHNAGFATAIIAVSVVNYYSDIELPDTSSVYTAPPSSTQAQFLALNYQPFLESDIPGSNGQFSAAGFSYYAAKGFCDARGARLPTLDELVKLKKSGKLKAYWPTKKNYWSSATTILDVTYKSIDMLSASDVPVDLFTHEFAYVTCVSDDEGTGDYILSVPFPETLKTASSFDYTVFYRGQNESSFKIFDGKVSLLNTGVTFTTTDIGAGKHTFHAGYNIGQFQAQFLLSAAGSPLDGVKFTKLVSFYGADLKGTYGALTSNAGTTLFNKTFNFSAGNDLFCRSGAIVDALGVSSNNYIGGTGGSEKTLTVGTSIAKLHIRSGDFQYSGDPKRVISYFGVIDVQGNESGCGSLGTNLLTNVQDYTLPIAATEKLTEVTVYSTGTKGYIHGIRVATDKVN